MNPKRIRLNLAISETVHDKLLSLVKDSESETVTECIRKSLAVFEDVIRFQKNGGKIIFVNAEGKEEILKYLF